MDRFEMAETLRRKAGISYGEAKQALEASGWDMQRAMKALQSGSMERGRKADVQKGWHSRASARTGETIRRGSRNHLMVTRDGKRILEMPAALAALLLLLIMLLRGPFLLVVLIGLLAGYRCKFISEAEDRAFREDVTAAAETAEEIIQRHAVNSLGEDAGAWQR